MSGVRGELCETDDLLEATAKTKKKDYIERRPGKGETLNPPWELKGKKWRRPKTFDELFEDKIWLLLFRLGFKSLNKDRQCKLEYQTYTKQIDVLGRDDLHAFVVQCRTAESATKNISARAMFEEFVTHKNDIRKALAEYWGHESFSRVCHIVALGSREGYEKDEQFVKDNPQHNLHLWTLGDIEYMEELAKSLGPISKQQLFAVMFAGKKNSKLERSYPAIKTRIGNKVVYNFIISAKELADYAYVHHRKLTSLSEASQAYQRMLRPKKLEQIKDFVDFEGGYFVNNIILNFTRHIEFIEPKRLSDTVEVGKVLLPGYYGCAWVIDGQHRLYGAASAKKGILLPVIALENISEAKQAELFVQINKKQTAVAGNLLWDLYSDIYQGSDEPREARFWLISEVAKRLGRAGPLQKKIEFESDLSTHKAPLTLNTVCTSMQLNCPWEILGQEGTSDERAKQLARVINCFFSAIRDLRKLEWDDPKANNVILTNNGFAVFFMLFSDIIRHLNYKQQSSLFGSSGGYQLIAEVKKLLEPAILLIEDAEEAKRIVKGTARGLQMDNARKMAKCINSFYPDFNPPRVDGAVTGQPEKSPFPNGVRERAALFEPKLREYVLNKLIEWYGAGGWWKQGMPGKLKDDLDREWAKATKHSPDLLNNPDPNKWKFNLCDMTRVVTVIQYGDNWARDDGFASIFLFEKEEISRRVIEIKAARDPEQHARESTSQVELHAATQLRWFSMVLTDNTLNPYAS